MRHKNYASQGNLYLKALLQYEKLADVQILRKYVAPCETHGI